MHLRRPPGCQGQGTHGRGGQAFGRKRARRLRLRPASAPPHRAVVPRATPRAAPAWTGWAARAAGAETRPAPVRAQPPWGDAARRSSAGVMRGRAGSLRGACILAWRRCPRVGRGAQPVRRARFRTRLPALRRSMRRPQEGPPCSRSVPDPCQPCRGTARDGAGTAARTAWAFSPAAGRDQGASAGRPPRLGGVAWRGAQAQGDRSVAVRGPRSPAPGKRRPPWRDDARADGKRHPTGPGRTPGFPAARARITPTASPPSSRPPPDPSPRPCPAGPRLHLTHVPEPVPCAALSPVRRRRRRRSRRCCR